MLSYITSVGGVVDDEVCGCWCTYGSIDGRVNVVKIPRINAWICGAAVDTSYDI
jgi:hypothetical protein